MKKRTRKILFSFFLFIFLIIAPTIVLYSQGYRFDFEKRKIVQTGGIFLKILPKSAEIFLNDKFLKKTDWFFGSVLIENLLPKKYKITVKKDGYFPWEKELEVKEKEVTEAKNIILWPRNLKFEILAKNVENFFPSPDESKIVLLEREVSGWSLKLYNLQKNLKIHLISQNDISQKEMVDFLDLEWSKDSKEIYLKVGLREKEKEYVLNLEKIPFNLTEREISNSKENVLSSSENYYLDVEGNLFKNGEKISQNPFPVKPETKYKLDVFQDYIFLTEDKSLYLFNQESKSFEKFFEGIVNLKISPDNKKIAFFSDFEIWILFLDSGKKIFITRVSENIKEVFWLNSDYLIFNSGKKIKISEIDERDKINIIDLAEFENPEIFFNQNNKKLYIFSEKNLYFSETLF